jgi:chromosome segregation ATPase
MKEAYDQKAGEAASLAKANADYARELAVARGKGEAAFVLERNNLEYEKRLSYASSEIDRLGITLREITSKYEESELRRRELERRVEKDDFQIKDYEGKLRMGGNEINHLKEIIQRLDG